MIIAFAGQKGGVGKSTTAICVACELLERGRSVLLVDADPQGTTSTWAAVATEAGRRTPTVVAMGAGMHRADQLPRVASSFDVAIIDCPPRHDAIQRSALMSADIVVLPCGPSAADAWALASSVELVRAAQTLRENLLAAVLVTRKQSRTTMGRTARVALEASELPVLDTELCSRVAYVEALAAGQGVTTYAPRDTASMEVRRLVTELERLAARSTPVTIETGGISHVA
jgi:chromosome partitioning protein